MGSDLAIRARAAGGRGVAVHGRCGFRADDPAGFRVLSMSESSDEEIAAALVDEVRGIHRSMDALNEAKARELKAGKDRAQAQSALLRHQTNTARLLASLKLGPNFAAVLTQVME